MEKAVIIYWSQTGNTKLMAEAIEEGVKAAGKEAEVLEVGSASVEALKDLPAFAIGCPAMGGEELEDSEMEPFVQEVEKIVSGKNVLLFGSYGWGDGEWMRDWVERMEKAGANIIGGEGLICQETPDDEAVTACQEAGKKLAAF